ncbi:unnamed protein product, partial [Brassica oleracea var. botrytis]
KKIWKRYVVSRNRSVTLKGFINSFSPLLTRSITECISLYLLSQNLQL